MTPNRGRPKQRAEVAAAEIPTIADARTLSLAPGRHLQSRLAGVFVFLPLLAKLGFDTLVHRAGYPGSTMVSAHSALISLLLLKLLDKERRSHIDDFNFDPALGLFAGLNVLPKKSFLTDYSYKTQRSNQEQLLAGWVGELSKQLFPETDGFNLDFHPIPFRGDPAGLDNHYLPRRGKAGPSVLACFAQERKSQVFCYSNTNLARADQPGAVLQFVEFWHAITGEDPKRLFFDSKMVPYEEMARLHERGIRFVTIRRRGKRIVDDVSHRPASQWNTAVLDVPKRRQKKIRFLDERVRVRGYDGELRQIAITGHGRDQPTLMITNDFEESPRHLILGYAGRNGIEDGLGICVNFFHLDCLASEVRLNVDLDAAATVLANGCYRWLGSRLRGFETAQPKALFRRFVETSGVVELTADRLLVRFDKRAHNPVLREAALDAEAIPIPWLGGLPVEFRFP